VSLISSEYYLNRTGMAAFLDEVEEIPESSAVSAYIPPGLSVAGIEELVVNTGVTALPDEIIQAASDSKSGAALFLGSQRRCLVVPPFPLKEKVVFSGTVTEPLRLVLAEDFTIGLVLVHLGTYAVGVCQGEKLVSSKVGTGLVHGRHRKGGSSQQRFQRRRENQARDFLVRVCGHAREHLKPYEKSLDYILYGGPRQTVLLLRKECPFLQTFEDRTLPVMDVPALRQKVLEAAVSRVWSSRVIEWREET
jgi:hypothetical protein